MSLAGSDFHGEFSSADASGLSEANSRFTLFEPRQKGSISLGSSDVVAITDIVVTTNTSLTVTIYDGANNSVASGETLAKVILSGTGVIKFTTPKQCQKGTYPKVLTNTSGQVDVQISGFIHSTT